MKHNFLLSALTAIVFFAVTTTADAGIFGRLSVVWNGCSPCEPAACQPCEPVACQPCEPIVCQPCEPICDPCEPLCGDCGYRPFRPFGGFFVNLKAKLAAAHCAPGCDPCEPVACQPCEPVACEPCEPVCDPCDPCGSGFVARPFGGFFAGLKAKLLASHCCDAGCDPCEPVCDPCAVCRW